MSIRKCKNRWRRKRELIETDRLLELIDQFAEAEGRMKWAPNKKLHFEVAMIKAIQSLGQVTLDEVIEKLGDLRDGKVRRGGCAQPHLGRSAPDTGATTTARVAEAEPEFRTSKQRPSLDPAELWKQVERKNSAAKSISAKLPTPSAHVLGLRRTQFATRFRTE